MNQRVLKKYAMAQPHFLQSEIDGILLKFKSILQGDGVLSQGKYVESFEKKFAEYSHCKYGVATNSCSAALEIALRFLRLQSNDEVIVPVETFIATGSAVAREGGKPVFAGIDPETFCLSLSEIKRLYNHKTKAIILVHMAGFITPEIEKIQVFCKKNNLFLIEDCAHAPGAEWNGKRAGSFGDCGCFSFYPTKIITTGEGGMLTTNNVEIYKHSNSFRHRGRDLDCNEERYSKLGTNNRMTEIAAILGLSQLDSLDQFIITRNEIAQAYYRYLRECESLGWIYFLKKPDNIRHSFWRFIVKLHPKFDRVLLKKQLADYNIPIDWAYSPPLHLQPVFQKYYTSKNDLFETETLMQHFFCLPIHPLLHQDDIEFISQKIINCLTRMATS